MAQLEGSGSGPAGRGRRGGRTHLEDEEILLRPWLEEDVPAIVAACQDSEILRWIPVSAPYTEEDGRRFVTSRSEGDFAIVDRRSGELLGSIALHLGRERPSVGYWVKKEARGRGVATRAVRLVSSGAFATTVSRASRS